MNLNPTRVLRCNVYENLWDIQDLICNTIDDNNFVVEILFKYPFFINEVDYRTSDLINNKSDEFIIRLCDIKCVYTP